MFKSNSRNKALQSFELGEALERDVVEPLRQLRTGQDQDAQEIYAQGAHLLQALKSKQEEVRQFATQYWRSAK